MVIMYNSKQIANYYIIAGIISFQYNNVSGFETIGCYWNDLGNIISDKYIIDPFWSTIDCMELCLGEFDPYTIVGTQPNPKTCVCGYLTNLPLASYKAADSECNLPCPLKVTDLCGGVAASRLAVFDITGESHPIQLNAALTSKEQAATTTLISTNWYTSGHTSNKNSILTTRTAYSEDTTMNPLTTGQDVESSAYTTNAEQNTYSVNQRNSKCCHCGKWGHLNGLNLTREELEIILKDDVAAIKKELTIDVKTISSYINSKISAPDNRTSSTVIGYFWGIFICIPFGLIVLSDICRIYGAK